MNIKEALCKIFDAEKMGIKEKGNMNKGKGWKERNIEKRKQNKKEKGKGKKGGIAVPVNCLPQSLGERQRMKSGSYCYGINSHYVMSFVIMFVEEPTRWHELSHGEIF